MTATGGDTLDPPQISCVAEEKPNCSVQYMLKRTSKALRPQTYNCKVRDTSTTSSTICLQCHGTSGEFLNNGMHAMSMQKSISMQVADPTNSLREFQSTSPINIHLSKQCNLQHQHSIQLAVAEALSACGRYASMAASALPRRFRMPPTERMEDCQGRIQHKHTQKRNILMLNKAKQTLGKSNPKHKEHA